jgi:hypothetical protein
MSELEQFIQFWYGPRRPEYGEPDVLDSYPELPGSLRRFYAFAGRWPTPNSGNQFFYAGECGHHLLPLDLVGPTDDGRLRFFMEYQGEWDGVTTPREVDPPVWITDLNVVPNKTRGARQVCGALSRFLVTHCLMATIFELSNSTNVWPRSHEERSAPAEWFHRERSSAEHLWDADPGGCPGYEGSFYLLDEYVLVLETTGGSLSFGAPHPQGGELLRSFGNPN